MWVLLRVCVCVGESMCMCVHVCMLLRVYMCALLSVRVRVCVLVGAHSLLRPQEDDGAFLCTFPKFLSISALIFLQDLMSRSTGSIFKLGTRSSLLFILENIAAALKVTVVGGQCPRCACIRHICSVSGPRICRTIRIDFALLGAKMTPRSGSLYMALNSGEIFRLSSV